MPQADLALLDLPEVFLNRLRSLLAKHVPTAEVLAYGSRVNGSSHEGSDLDLVLQWQGTDEDYAGWQALIESLQNSSLPMMVEVHLWSRLPAEFHRQIEHRHVLLQKPTTKITANVIKVPN